MPCNSDYLQPTAREAELRHTAELLVYALTSLQQPVSRTATTAAANPYCKADLVPNLCAVIRSMTPEQLDKIVYDGRNDQAVENGRFWMPSALVRGSDFYLKD